MSKQLSGCVWVPIMFHTSTVEMGGISKERPKARVAMMKRDRSIDLGRFGNLIRRDDHDIGFRNDSEGSIGSFFPFCSVAGSPSDRWRDGGMYDRK
jgi:hypothetical protein